ncbi:NAD(P)-dependent oxidoreductase [Sorangium sp. So ce1335]
MRSGLPAGAGLDVTDPEPLPAEHPPWKLPNAIITPHTSGRLVVVQPVSDVNGASDRPSASGDAPGPPASALDRGRLGSKE